MMCRIKTILLLLIILISTINVLSAEKNIKNKDNETYEVLKAVSKRYKCKLNREILSDKKIVDKVTSFTTYYSFCNFLYKGLWQVDIKQVITKNDIIELQQNINISKSPKKWSRKILKKHNILTTRHKLGNYKFKSLIQTSYPIFFKSDEFAILYVHKYSSRESGQKSIEVLRKNSSGSWEYFGEILIGIS